jgi:hypothetical protein
MLRRECRLNGDNDSHVSGFSPQEPSLQTEYSRHIQSGELHRRLSDVIPIKTRSIRLFDLHDDSRRATREVRAQAPSNHHKACIDARQTRAAETRCWSNNIVQTRHKTPELAILCLENERRDAMREPGRVSDCPAGPEVLAGCGTSQWGPQKGGWVSALLRFPGSKTALAAPRHLGKLSRDESKTS